MYHVDMWSTPRFLKAAAEPYELKPVVPFCSQCGYDLRGTIKLTGARCPECGSQLQFDQLKFKRDRKEQRRYRHSRPVRFPMRVTWTRLEVTVVALLMALTVYFILIGPVYMIKFFVPLALLIEFALAHAIISCVRHWQVKRYEKRQRHVRSHRSTVD